MLTPMFLSRRAATANVLDEFGTHLLVKPAQIPARFFASNNAMVESGPIPGNLLLGVSTPARTATL